MKKVRRMGKKTLSVLMAVLMVMTTWVFVAPTKASAVDAGTYDVQVKLVVSDTAVLDQDETDKLILYHTAHNGTASSEAQSKATIGKETLNSASAEFEFTGVGFPTGVKLDNLEFSQAWNSGWGTIGLVFEIYVKKNGTYTKIAESSTYSSSEWDNGNFFTFDYDIPQTEAPKATSIVWNSTDPTDITLSSTSTTTYTRNLKYYIKDQYGVVMSDTALSNKGTPVSYTLECSNFPSLNNTGDIGTDSSASPYLYHTHTNTTSEHQVAIKVSSLLRSSVDGLNERTVTFTLTCGDLEEIKTFNINDAKHTITFNKNATDASNLIPANYSVYYGESLASQSTLDGTSTYPTSGSRTGYVFLGMYDAAEGGNLMNVNEEVTTVKTYYAHWEILKYAAVFMDRSGDNVVLVESDIEHGSSAIKTDEATSKLNKVEYDDVNHYTLSETDVWNPSTDSVTGNTFFYPKYTANPHTLDSGTAIEANCQHGAGIEYKCTGCDYSYIEETSTTLGDHAKSDSYIVDTEATCLTVGSGHYYCTVCSATVETIEIPAHGHSYQWEITKTASCTQLGNRRYTCTVCGYVHNEEIPLTQHNYVAGETVKANCQHSPYTVYTCSGCNDTYNKYEGNATTEHNWSWEISGVTADNKKIVTGTCDVCGAVAETSVDLPVTHNFTSISITKQPTCKESGEITISCADSGCTESYTATLPTVSTAHNEYETAYDAAECGKAGTIVITCKDCGTKISEKEIAALNHSYDYVRVEPTCTVDGSITKTCANCGDKQTETIYSTGHKNVTVTANCQHGGYDECSVCGEKSNETKATPHDFTGEVIEIKATCKTEGIKLTKCAKCDAQQAEKLEIVSCEYEDTVISPTCTDRGFTIHICKMCGNHVIDTYVSANGHSWINETTITEPSCGVNGKYEHSCEVCGISETFIKENALAHDYETTETVNATCTTKGYTVKTCDNCGDVEYTDVKEADGHNWKAYSTAADCTVAVESGEKCSVCGLLRNVTVTDPDGHNFSGTETVISKATCTADGKKTVACANANCTVTTEVTIPKLGHNYVASSTVAPTCTHSGYTVYVCQNDASHTYNVYDETKPAVDHSWSEWEVTKAATNDADGEQTRECSVCGETETAPVAALKHSMVEDVAAYVAPTCTAEGKRVYECNVDHNGVDCAYTLTVEIPAAGHKLATTVENATCTGTGSVVTKCTVDGCGHIELTTTLQALGHTWNDGVVTTPASCTATGIKTYTCLNDGSHTKEVVLAMVQHEFKAGTEVAPTCTKSGYIPYACGCGKSYNEITADAIGHNFSGAETIVDDATCTADGSKKVACANNCGESTTVAIPATGHTYTEKVIQKQSCTAAEKTEYTCNCGASYVEITKEAAGHSFGAWTEVQAATTDSYGIEKRTCSVCSYAEHRTTVPTGAHDFKEVGSTPATCTADGSINWECQTHTDCEANYTETIDKLGHTEELSYTPASCEKEGSTAMVCSVCNATLDSEVIPATGHTYDEGVVTTAATCSEEGEKTYTCSCGKTRTETIAKIAHSLTTTYNKEKCDENGSVVVSCDNCPYEVTEPIAKRGHTWGATPVSTVAATCEDTGSETYKCDNCTETKDVIIPKLGHIYTASSTVAPTCTHSGYTVYVCQNDANHTYNVYDETKPAVDHSWSEWEVTKAATNDADGEQTRKCSVCGKTETAPVAALKHSMVEDAAAYVAPTCTAEGKRVYECNVDHNGVDCGYSIEITLDKIAHVLTTNEQKASCEENGSVVTSCVNCNEVNETTTIYAHGHSYEAEVTTDPTCTSEGVRTYTCAHNSTHTYTEAIEKLPHSFVAGTEIKATCTESGYIPYTCSCGENYVKITADAKGHTYEEVANSSTATCTAKGEIKLRCACGAEMTADVPALGHDYVKGAETSADCANPATAVYECSRCSDAYTEITSGKTDNHSWNNWVTGKEATAESDGYKTRTCKICEQLEYEVLPSTGTHSYSIVIDSKAPTCEEEGYEVKDCATHTGDADCGLTSKVILPATGHTEELVYTPANCETAGSTSIFCDVCDTTLDSKEIPALGHKWGKGSVATQPTCKAEGVMAYTCERDASHTKTEAIAVKPNAHVYTITTTDATCLAPATTTYTCACGEEKTVVTDFTLGHNWDTDKTVDVPATCTQNGIKSTHCSNCDMTKDQEIIPATGHTAETQTKAPTCTTAGFTADICKVCGAVTSAIEVTEALGHTWGTPEMTDATCAEGAKETKTCTVDGCNAKETTITSMPNEHVWGEWQILEGEGKKRRDCENCDAYEECEIPASGHNWNGGVETTAATCYSEGVMTYTCQGCDICTAAGTTATATVAISKLAHTFIKVEEAAGCEEKGSVVVKCSVAKCGYEAQSVEISATGHTLVRDTDNDKDPTCDTIGQFAYKCTNDGCTHTEAVERPALGHSYSTQATTVTPATCTTDGVKKYKCSRCDAAIETEIPALGHSFTIEETVAPTCTDKGYIIKKCSACSESYVVTDSFTDAKGHSWSDWETVTAATNDADGLKKRICKTDASHVEYAPVPMLGHEWNSGVITSKATCETDGEKLYTCIKTDCTVCGSVPATYTETIPATGHNMTSVDVDGDCLVPAYKLWTCQNGCGNEYITITGSADGHDYELQTETLAKCEEDGNRHYECADCDANYDEVLPKLGHKYEESTVAATCTTSGYILHTCKNDVTHAYKEFTTEATGHKWSAWVVTTAPTDTADGVKERECINANCNAKETETVPALIHNMYIAETVDATCKTPGKIVYKCDLTHEGYTETCTYEYTVNLPVLAHELSTERDLPDCENTGSVVTSCANCDYEKKTDFEALGHNWNDGEVSKKATCIETGIKTYTCSRCKETKTEVLEMIQHEVKLVENVAATCTSRGYKTYECTTDGCTYGYTILGDAPTDHVDTRTETTASSCTQSGITKVICNKCGTIVSATAVDPSEHSYKNDGAVVVTAPTCTEAGYTTYNCDNCDETHVGDIVEATGHSYKNEGATEVTAPTCTEAGYTIYNCDNCNESHKDNYTEALGHDWNAWEVTAGAGGDVMKRTCKRDASHTEQYSIPSGGHTFDTANPTSTTKGTCTVMGTKTFICTAHTGCGVEITVETEYGAHNWGEWTVTPGESNDTISRVCQNEATHTESYEIPAGGHTFDTTKPETTEGDCQTKGTSTFKCTMHADCGVTITVDIGYGEHKYKTEREEAGCEANGYVKTFCEICDETFSNEIIYATGHDYDANNDGIIDRNDAVYFAPVQNADGTWTDGYYTYTCQNDGCSKSYNETIAETFKVSFFDAKGNQIGETQTVKFGQSAVAPASPEKAADENYHYIFSNWDRKFSSVTADVDVYPLYDREAHYGGEATCKEKAECGFCGSAYGETDASQHVMASTTTAATCEADGQILYYCTEGCGYSYTVTLKKLQHIFGEWQKVVEGDCKVQSVHIRSCLNSGCKKTEERTFYEPHTFIVTEGSEPTCIKDGLTEHKYCIVCEYEINAEPIPAKGHSDLNGDGKCDYCGYTNAVPECSCMCHSEGFLQIIYKIFRFFWMLTRTQQKCQCGAYHW